MWRLLRERGGDKLNAGLLKAITGGDSRTVRLLYTHKKEEYNLILKPVLLTNHKPEINVNDQAMLDRLVYIPFNARFTEEPKHGEFMKDCNKIKMLTEKYLSEVFTFIVRGAKMFFETQSLKPPQSIKDATVAYINEFDTINKFIQEKCVVDSKEKIKTSQLYQSYTFYCADNGLEPKNNKEFVNIVKEKFEVTGIKGYPYYRGINIMETNY